MWLFFSLAVNEAIRNLAHRDDVLMSLTLEVLDCMLADEKVILHELSGVDQFWLDLLITYGLLSLLIGMILDALDTLEGLILEKVVKVGIARNAIFLGAHDRRS